MNEELYELYKHCPIEILNGSLIDACCLGRLERVKFLINEMNVDINFNNDQPFREACRSKSFDIVEYLLTSNELKKHSKINNCPENDVTGLSYACVNGDLKLVQYLLASPDLKELANVNLNNDNALKLAFYREQDAVLEYLIFEYKIPYTEDIKKHLNSIVTYSGKENYNKHVNNMFLARELNNELSSKQNTSKKVKL
jgi:ankyrin repeat protein